MDDTYDQPNVDFIIGGQVMTAGTAPAQLRPVLAKIEDEVRRKLAGLKDKHGMPLKVIMQGNDLKSMQFELRGSKEVVEEAQRRLRGV